MEEHIAHIQKRFPVVVELKETSNNFFRGGRLFTTNLNNDYCYILKQSDVFISFFQSGWIPLEKIESDYLDCSTTFLASDPEFTRVIMEALV
jgi:ATP-dependent protease HslVU (ClpYQ) ATPase subunit